MGECWIFLSAHHHYNVNADVTLKSAMSEKSCQILISKKMLGGFSHFATTRHAASSRLQQEVR